MTKPDTWYVTFEPVAETASYGSLCKTRSFKSEIDAKLFAKEMLAKGWKIQAGTLDEVQPAAKINATSVHAWAATPLPR